MTKKALACLSCAEDAVRLTEEIGLLPLFESAVSGFSVMELTPQMDWFSGDSARDPWDWRKEIARTERVAYGKFLEGKAAFIARSLLPDFANYRRDGYDFDALWEEGLARPEWKRIMDEMQSGEARLSPDIKRATGVKKGFGAAAAALQMKGYLSIVGFDRRMKREGGEYGWPCARYQTLEARFGGEFIRSRYDARPEDSLKALTEKIQSRLPDARAEDIGRLLKR